MQKKFFLALIIACSFALATSAQTTPAPTTPGTVMADSASYTGKYKYEGMPFEYMVITIKDTSLYFSGGEYQGAMAPVKDKKDVFDANGQATFSFVRDKDNKVTDMTIDYQGQVFSGKKEPK